MINNEQFKKDNEKLKKLIKDNEIILFRVEKGENIDSERSSVIFRSVNTNTETKLDATIFYTAKDPSFSKEWDFLYFINPDNNEHERVDYVDGLFFVINKNTDLKLKNNFYFIPDFINYYNYNGEYNNYAEHLCQMCTIPDIRPTVTELALKHFVPITPKIEKHCIMRDEQPSENMEIITLTFEVERGEKINDYSFYAQVKLSDESKNLLQQKLNNYVQFDNLDGYVTLDYQENKYSPSGKLISIGEGARIVHNDGGHRDEFYLRLEKELPFSFESSQYMLPLDYKSGIIIQLYSISNALSEVKTCGFMSSSLFNHLSPKDYKLLFDRGYIQPFPDSYTKNILQKLLHNKNNMSVEEIYMKFSDVIDEERKLEEERKIKEQVELNEFNEYCKELIKSKKLLLFKVEKGEKISDQRSAVIIKGVDNIQDLKLDTFFIHNDDQDVYAAYYQDGFYTALNFGHYENLFFVLNNNDQLQFRSGFYSIPELGNYAKSLRRGPIEYNEYKLDSSNLVNEIKDQILKLQKDSNKYVKLVDTIFKVVNDEEKQKVNIVIDHYDLKSIYKRAQGEDKHYIENLENKLHSLKHIVFALPQDFLQDRLRIDDYKNHTIDIKIMKLEDNYQLIVLDKANNIILKTENINNELSSIPIDLVKLERIINRYSEDDHVFKEAKKETFDNQVNFEMKHEEHKLKHSVEVEKQNEQIEPEVIKQFIPIIPKQSVINTSVEQKTSIQQDEGNNLQSEAAVTLHKDNSKSEIVNNNTEETKSPITSLLDGLKGLWESIVSAVSGWFSTTDRDEIVSISPIIENEEIHYNDDIY